VRRILAILVVALALTPGLLWRDPPVSHDRPQPLLIRPLPLPAGGVRLAPGMTLSAGWELASRDEAFGGYSALVPLPGGVLLALSDRGRFLRFDPPHLRSQRPVMGAVGGADDSDKRRFDVEAATRDPASGVIGLGYEGRNSINRTDARLRALREVRPPQMRSWPANRGPEALVRLGDGRFLVLSEAFDVGLLFPGDPIGGAEPAQFRFVLPPGFRPTDAALLPDGRVVILLRRLQLWLPPRLTSRLVVADPAMIVPGEEWGWQSLAEIAAPLPAENYEGLAVEPRGQDAVRLWLIADDNSAVMQRTLLLALDWRLPTKKARGSTAGPSKPSN
jgi:hypothetical protein